ncbi:MAG: hypothetical protein ABSB33_08755 [Tepidisphaeraceae bacterium]
MIRVSCAECGGIFEIGEEFAGLTEFCPVCGALCDIPSTEEQGPQTSAEEPQPAAPEEPEFPGNSPPVFAAAPARGIPAPLWWALIVGGVAFFVVACVLLFSDTWEMRNLQALNDAANRGDVLMVDEDFTGAAAQYRFVLNTVADRQIDSIYIRQLVERARRGAAMAQAGGAQAQNHPRAAATSAPTVASAPATRPDDHAALRDFQRDSEAFPLYVHNRPLVFQDDKGHWRRRQFTVWDVSYQKQPDSDRPRILLLYSCASRITEPHDSRREAEDDGDFINDESPKTVHCQTLFELFAGQWIMLHQEVDSGVTTRPSSEDFYELERQAFRAAVIPQ